MDGLLFLGERHYLNMQLRVSSTFRDTRSLAPYSFLSERVSKFTISSLRLFCFLLFDVLKSNASFNTGIHPGISHVQILTVL